MFTLWLRPDLHAKYYRADDTCMVGSANLTHSALGWSNRSNLELLVPLSKETTSLVQFEQNLFTNCVRVNHSVYDQIKKAVEAYKENHSVVPVETNFERNNADLSSVEISSFTTWIPSLRDPSLLYLAYIGASEKLTIASRESAYRDLAALSVIPGLSQRAFELSVRALLLQNPTIRAIDDFTIVPQRFGAVSAFLKSLPCAKVKNFDAKRAWQTIMRWLLYFFPERYSVLTPRHSEIFFRIDTRA